MADWQIRTVLPYTTGLPRDVSVCTWAVETGDEDPPDLNPWEQFFNAGPPQLGAFISATVSRASNACRVEAYQILNKSGDGELSSLVASLPFTLWSPTTGNSFPLEVALCSSFASEVPPGVSERRRRGRVYIGPFNASAATVGTGMPTPLDSLRTALANRTEALADALATAGHPLCVWSRADAALYPVVRGWVDNAWDTQRRREVDPTARTTWSL